MRLPLVDRDIELAAVQSLLQATPPPVVEVSGRVGVGKTALVRNLKGVFYIDAAGLNCRELLQRLFERACVTEIRYVPSLDRLRAIFMRWKMPVVIDGFMGSNDDLYTILDVLKSVPVVYTTKEPRHLDASVLELRLAGLRPHAARELFERSFGASIADDVDAMEFVNVVLEGNPLLIGHAAALAQAGALSSLQGPEPLAALTFNSMSISEQQVFGTIAGFEGTRPDREMIETVSNTPRAGSVLESLIARNIVQTDGQRVWVSPLMRPILSAIPSLIRYDVIFDYMDVTLSQTEMPRNIADNPKPFLLMLGHVLRKGRHDQAVRNGRVLVNCFVLAGRLEEAREACELLRFAADETSDQTLRAWIQHQLGTLSALSGDHEGAITWLESAEALREQIGDRMLKAYSRKNAALLRGKVHRKGVRRGILRDVTMISWAIVLTTLTVLGYTLGWFSTSSYKATYARAHKHAHARMLAKHRAAPAIALAALIIHRAPVVRVAPVVHVAPLIHIVSQVHAASVAQSPVVKAVVPRAATPFIGVPRITRFTASEKSLVAGASTALCFKLTGATSAYLQPVGKIDALKPGCVNDAPHANTYYTLYAYNQNGMTSASVYVDVLPANAPNRRGLQAHLDEQAVRIP